MAEVDKAELRRLWRLQWLSSIQELSDLEVQQARWGKDSSPHFSYREYVCCYFDDLALTEHDGGYRAAIEKGLVSADEAKAIEPFHQALGRHKSPTTDFDDEAVLADPAWLEVVSKAAEAQSALLEIISDDAELWHLTQP